MSTSNSPESPSTSTSGRTLTARKDEFVYKPISTMAVVCLIGSIIGLTAFVNSVMIILAVIVLVISIITNISLSRSKSEYGGQMIATVAILLSLVGTIGAATKHVVTYYALTREADQFAQTYLDNLLADDLESAFAMSLSPQARAYCRDDVAEMLKTYNSQYEAFKSTPITKLLRAGGTDSKVTFLENTEIYPYLGLDLVGVKMRVQLAHEPKQTYDVTLPVHGGVSQAGDWEGRQWYISNNEQIVEVSPDGAAKGATPSNKEGATIKDVYSSPKQETPGADDSAPKEETPPVENAPSGESPTDTESK